MRITIITPCLNAESRIAETVSSVLGQTALRSGRAELEFLVCDGGSTDGTLGIVKSFQSPWIRIVSEPDRGLYEALARGLVAQTGDVNAYLNAGDLYSPHAFDVVLDVMEDPGVSWLTGLTVIHNDRSQVVSCGLPYRYRRGFMRAARYGRPSISWPGFMSRLSRLPFIQQESTFWRAQLNELLDLPFLSGLRYAGDAYLWSRFAVEHELAIVEAHLGGFRKHEGQLSEDLVRYYEEIELFGDALPLRDRLLALWDRAVWVLAPPALKKAWNPGLYRYDFASRRWA